MSEVRNVVWSVIAPSHSLIGAELLVARWPPGEGSPPPSFGLQRKPTRGAPTNCGSQAPIKGGLPKKAPNQGGPGCGLKGHPTRGGPRLRILKGTQRGGPPMADPKKHPMRGAPGWEPPKGSQREVGGRTIAGPLAAIKAAAQQLPSNTNR